MTAINWLALVVSCWWNWDRLCGSTPSSHGVRIDAPIELTELLLPAHRIEVDE